MTKAAWKVMREQSYGRIVNITSGAGLYGNFGQANYSAAKMAVLGLTTVLAKEGNSRNIKVNAVNPIVGTRMTESILAKEIFDLLKAEYVVPLVVVLAHETCEHTGAAFEAGGGWFA